MRGFMVLCLAAVAVAAPQGYHYQPTINIGSGGLGAHSAGFGVHSAGLGVSSSGLGLSSSGLGVHSAGLGLGSVDLNGLGSNLGSAGGFGAGFDGFSSGPVVSSGAGFDGSFVSGGSVGVPSFSAGPVLSAGSGLSGGSVFSAGPVLSSAPVQTLVQPTVVEYNKKFYFHDAPEDFEDAHATQELASTLKKNLNVVFIKAPENKGLQNAALQLVKQANEEKTAIYVLTKQADLSELRNQVQQIQSTTQHKPEVHFVKYRTQEDAEHAQHSIQAQYDALGGSSQSSHEGVAPVVNYASSFSGPQYSTSSLGVPQYVNSPLVAPEYTTSLSGPLVSGSIDGQRYGTPQVTISAPIRSSASYLPPISKL